MTICGSWLKSKRVALVGFFSVSLLLAVVVSPFASSDPDGLDRVSEDLGFTHRADSDPIAEKLPSANVFSGYALRQVPDAIATPLAGLLGTCLSFGLAWGVGKLAARGSHTSDASDSSDP